MGIRPIKEFWNAPNSKTSQQSGVFRVRSTARRSDQARRTTVTSHLDPLKCSLYCPILISVAESKIQYKHRARAQKISRSQFIFLNEKETRRLVLGCDYDEQHFKMTDCRQLRLVAHDAVDHFYYTGQDKVPQGIPAAVVDSSIIQIPPVPISSQSLTWPQSQLSRIDRFLSVCLSVVYDTMTTDTDQSLDDDPWIENRSSTHQ